MTSPRVPLILPDLGLGNAVVVVGQWLVEPDRPVTIGDRLVEVLSDGVTVDLPSPASGRLAEVVVAEDDEVKPGAILGWIEAEEE